MDWIKIKKKHISPAMDLDEIGALVSYQLLVADIERVPKVEEICKGISRKCYKKLLKIEEKYEKDLQKIAEKVLEDVEKGV